MSPIARYLFIVGRRGSLGDKSLLQSTRRAKRFRVALRIADNEADADRLQRALKAGERSGPASPFDGQSFLRHTRAIHVSEAP
ncbi:type II toxin-antitoxin system ParD family antitoxin [Trinickia violacea]